MERLEGRAVRVKIQRVGVCVVKRTNVENGLRLVVEMRIEMVKVFSVRKAGTAMPLWWKRTSKHFAAEAVTFVRRETGAFWFSFLFAICYKISARLV